MKNCLNCKIPKCKEFCPIHMPMNEIIAAMNNNDELTALSLIENINYIGFVTGDLCDHNRGCNGHCVNKKNPVLCNEVCKQIGIKRLDYIKFNSEPNGKKIAVIGGGVSGLVISELLMKDGYDVTIFEKENQLGGVLSSYMPDFRYDSTYLKRYINILLNGGLKAKFSQTLGLNLKIEDLNDYDLVIFAQGVDKPINPFKEKSPYILDALNSLINYKNNKLSLKNKRILVFGGGNTAYDVARVYNCLRNRVSIVYRRDIPNSPASIKEINQAINEGVEIKELLNPFEFIFDHEKLTGVKCHKTILIDDGGSRLNFKELDDEVILDADYVVISYGHRFDNAYLKEALPNSFDESGKPINNGKYYFIGDASGVSWNFATANKSAIDTFNLIKSSQIVEE